MPTDNQEKIYIVAYSYFVIDHYIEIALAMCIVHRNAILLSGTAQAVTKATNELYTRFGYLWQRVVAR